MITLTDIERMEYRDIWVVAEVSSGKVQPVTHELIGTARQLADTRKSQVCTVVMGSGISKMAESLFAYGSDSVIVVDDSRLNGIQDEIEARLLVRLIKKYKPEVVLCAATTKGRALIPRVAVMSNCGLTADCTGLSIDPDNGDLLQTRPAFGGNILATIRSSNHRPQMATVRPRVMKAPEPDHNRHGKVIKESILETDADKMKKIIEIFHSKEASLNLSDARIIIAGGRGVRDRKASTY